METTDNSTVIDLAQAEAYRNRYLADQIRSDQEREQRTFQPARPAPGLLIHGNDRQLHRHRPRPGRGLPQPLSRRPDQIGSRTRAAHFPASSPSSRASNSWKRPTTPPSSTSPRPRPTATVISPTRSDRIKNKSSALSSQLAQLPGF